MINFQELGIEIRGSGQHKTKCPECVRRGKTQGVSDLSVDPAQGLFNCHKCTWNNGDITGQKTQTYIPQPPKPKIQGEYRPDQLSDLTEAALGYFDKRGISKETLFKTGVRSCQKWMPQYKKEVETIAFQFIKSNQRVNTKYRTAKKEMTQDKNAAKCFYNFEVLERKPKRIYITEGEIDTLTLIECNYLDSISVPDGAPNPSVNNLDNKFSYFTEEAMKLFDKIQEVVLVTDNDENGRFLEKELKRRIGADKCLFINYPEGCKDINDVLVKEGPEAVEDVLNDARHCPIDGVKTFRDFKREIQNMRDGVSCKYYETGCSDMDKHLKIKMGQLNIVTGSPGCGKSEWVDEIVVSTAKQYGLKWVIFSPENNPSEVYFRKLAAKYHIKSFDSMNDSEINEATDYLSDHIQLLVDSEEEDISIDYLLERVKSLVFRHGINGVVLDPWNEILNETGAREDLYISKVLRKIKRFSRLYDITFWIVAHPKNPKMLNDGSYPRITAYDIVGGYAWFAKADNLFSVWRDKDNHLNPVEISIQKIKQKTDGKEGICYLHYDYESGTYTGAGSSLDDKSEVQDCGGMNVNGFTQ